MRISRLVWTVVVGLFVVLAVAGPVLMLTEDEGGAEAAATDTVSMEGLQFSPETATVARGTEVEFVNDDVAPHTVTEEGGDIDSGLLNPGDTFRLVVDEPLAYICTVHPSMKARVELEG